MIVRTPAHFARTFAHFARTFAHFARTLKGAKCARFSRTSGLIGWRTPEKARFSQNRAHFAHFFPYFFCSPFFWKEKREGKREREKRVGLEVREVREVRGRHCPGRP